MMRAVDPDLFAPEAVADPYTYYGRLREEDPVHWNDKFGFWIITRYDDVVWAVRHPEVFAQEEGQDQRQWSPRWRTEAERAEYVRQASYQMFINRNPPDHTRMRAGIHPHFTPMALEGVRPMVREEVNHLLDQVEPKGQMDVMFDFANVLTVVVIARMMGLPIADRVLLRNLARDFLALEAHDATRWQRSYESVTTIADYLTPMIEQRRATPRDDLLSVLVEAEKGGVLTREEVLHNAILLLVAGHQTTINFICNGTLALMRHPDQWKMLANDPSLVGKAPEELLRYDPPLKMVPVMRLLAQDVEMRGKGLRKGDRAVLIIASANRDPRKFSAPDRLDIARWPNPHLAFGGGIHHCLGAPLARLEGQEVFRAFTKRFPPFRLEAKEVRYHPFLIFRSLTALPVSWN